MAEELAIKGNEVTVVTGQPYYPHWKRFDSHPNRFTSAVIENVKVLRSPIFLPTRVKSLGRLLLLCSFALSSLPQLLAAFRARPQICIVVIPTMFCLPLAQALGLIFRVKVLAHIQDLEVDAFAKKSKLVRSLAHPIEFRLLSWCSLITTISTGMKERLVLKGIHPSRISLCPNWSELTPANDSIRAEELWNSLGVVIGKPLVLYSGNLGEKQGLGIIFDLALCLPQFQFIVLGDGALKPWLINRSEDLALPNLLIGDLQPFDKLPTLFSMVNCHLVLQDPAYTDLVMPSKLTNIFAVGGNAVVTAYSNTSLGLLCDEHEGLATRVEPNSLESISTGIVRAVNKPIFNSVAKNYAAENMSRSEIIGSLLTDIRSTVEM